MTSHMSVLLLLFDQGPKQITFFKNAIQRLSDFKIANPQLRVQRAVIKKIKNFVV